MSSFLVLAILVKGRGMPCKSDPGRMVIWAPKFGITALQHQAKQPPLLVSGPEDQVPPPPLQKSVSAQVNSMALISDALTKHSRHTSAGILQACMYKL
jgi:hypothetical protein